MNFLSIFVLIPLLMLLGLWLSRSIAQIRAKINLFLMRFRIILREYF